MMWKSSCSAAPGGVYRETEPVTEFHYLLFIQLSVDYRVLRFLLILQKESVIADAESCFC